MSDRGLLIRGSAYLAVLDASDQPLGWSDALNMVTCQVEQAEATIATRSSNHAHNPGAALDSIQVAAGVQTVTLSIDTIDGELLATALGASYAKAVVAAKVAAPTPVILYKGKRAFTGSYNATAIVASAGNTLVAGTDFEVDLPTGSIKALAGGAVIDGDSYSFDVSAPGRTHDVLGGGRQTYTVALRVIGEDKASGSQVILRVAKLPLSGTQTFDLATGEYSQVSYSGTPVEVGGAPAYVLEPYSVSA